MISRAWIFRAAVTCYCRIFTCRWCFTYLQLVLNSMAKKLIEGNRVPPISPFGQNWTCNTASYLFFSLCVYAQKYRVALSLYPLFTHGEDPSNKEFQVLIALFLSVQEKFCTGVFLWKEWVGLGTVPCAPVWCAAVSRVKDQGWKNWGLNALACKDSATEQPSKLDEWNLKSHRSFQTSVSESISMTSGVPVWKTSSCCSSLSESMS